MPFPRCNSLCVATFRIHTLCSCVPAHPNPICLSQGSQGIVCAIFGESGQRALIVTVRGSEFLLASQLSQRPIRFSQFAARLLHFVIRPSPLGARITHLTDHSHHGIYYALEVANNSLLTTHYSQLARPWLMHTTHPSLFIIQYSHTHNSQPADGLTPFCALISHHAHIPHSLLFHV